MTTYAFPSVIPSASSIQLVSNTLAFQSALNGAIQTLDRGGERWIIDLQYQNLNGADRAVMQAFLAKLNGQQHRFTLYNHAENQRGAFGGTPLVNGADQTGTTLAVDGATASVTNWIREGDWFGVNGELKMAIADTSSDGSGEVTISFRPRLRSAPADNAALTTSAATGVFMLDSNSVSWSNRPGGFSSLAFRAVEDIAA